jgi:hypothetical protein
MRTCVLSNHEFCAERALSLRKLLTVDKVVKRNLLLPVFIGTREYTRYS